MEENETYVLTITSHPLCLAPMVKCFTNPSVASVWSHLNEDDLTLS